MAKPMAGISTRPQGERLRLLLVDDHEIVLQGLHAMMSAFPEDVTVVGSVSTVAETLELVSRCPVDIVLTDLRLGGESGLDLCIALRPDRFEGRVVILTVYDDEQYLFQALKVGAAGFLLKRVDGRELVRYLRAVARGDTVIDPALAGRVATTVSCLRNGEFWPGARLGLTQRESEVLALLVAGLSNRAIAVRLVVSDHTVKAHLRALYRKLDVPERGAAIAVALREGIFH
jgi:DNA-binding NarL/FixJ family response regulator